VAALAAAQLLSIAGDRIHYLALVAILTGAGAAAGAGADRAGSGGASGLVVLGGAMLLPALLFSPFAGPLVDRWSLVAILVATDAARALVVAALPGAFDAGGASLLLAGVLAAFTLNVLFLPARSALPPRLVPPGELLGLNALLVLCGVAATVAGSAIGGRVVDAIGWRAALYLDAATFAVSAALLATLAGAAPRRARARRWRARRYLRLVAGGLALAARPGRTRRALLAAAGLWVGGGFLHVAGALHAQPRPGEVARIGSLIGVFAAGLALSVGWAMTRRRVAARPALSGGLFGAALGLALFAATRSSAVLAGGALWTGLCVGPLLAASETELQEAAGERRRGRAFAARDFTSRLAFLVSIAAAGALVQATGPAATLAAGALALAALAAVVLRPLAREAPRG
jgi:MFS family permease